MLVATRREVGLDWPNTPLSEKGQLTPHVQITWGPQLRTFRRLRKGQSARRNSAPSVHPTETRAPKQKSIHSCTIVPTALHHNNQLTPYALAASRSCALIHMRHAVATARAREQCGKPLEFDSRKSATTNVVPAHRVPGTLLTSSRDELPGGILA